ncbi:hypothetical protein PIB30_055987, partial [Stylosanthes scabra]|nr:hypothetical protein [Stylosanthes scabra]
MEFVSVLGRKGEQRDRLLVEVLELIFWQQQLVLNVSDVGGSMSVDRDGNGSGRDGKSNEAASSSRKTGKRSSSSHSHSH